MPALPQLYPYKAGPVEPIVMPGEVVGIWVNKVYHFATVEYIEPLPESNPIVIDLGALAAGASVGPTRLGNLDMPGSEFAQYRYRVVNDIEVSLSLGRSDLRYKMHNVNAHVSRFTALNNPDAHLTEFFVYEDQHAFMTALNPTSYNNTESKIAFWGFRYVLDQAIDNQYSYAEKKLPAQWTRVPATAHL